MQVQEAIILENFGELEKFLTDFQLFGEVEFAAPVEDNHGKILIKDNIAFSANMFARLKDHEGNYKERFEVKITPGVARKIRGFLGREITRSNLRRIEHDFVEQLLEDVGFSVIDLVTNSLQSRRLMMALFKVYFVDNEFFAHVSRLGLLSLALVTRMPRLPLARRYGFLAGLTADLALVDSQAWRYPVISGPAKQKLALACARFASNFLEEDDVLDAIADHPIPETPWRDQPRSTGSPVSRPDPGERDLAGESVMFSEILQIPLDGEGEAPEGTEDGEEAAAEPAVLHTQEGEGGDIARSKLLTEALRIARYVDDIGKRFKNDPAAFAEEAIYLIAYLSGRGYFDEALSDRIIQVFQSYRAKAMRVRKIAGVEASCVHPPSAWAYPRPYNAAQILCQKRVYDCPHLVPNWSMHVVSAADVYGWLGAVLDPGEYPKCDLGRDLKSLSLPEAGTPASEGDS